MAKRQRLGRQLLDLVCAAVFLSWTLLGHFACPKVPDFSETLHPGAMIWLLVACFGGKGIDLNIGVNCRPNFFSRHAPWLYSRTLRNRHAGSIPATRSLATRQPPRAQQNRWAAVFLIAIFAVLPWIASSAFTHRAAFDQHASAWVPKSNEDHFVEVGEKMEEACDHADISQAEFAS
jgi:hypothetical protein